MAKREKMDLLTAVEHIVALAKGSGLSDEYFQKADKYIKYVSKKMELTKRQSVMMALFVENCYDENIKISDFGEYLECGTTRMLQYMSDIDVLEKRELVICSRSGQRLSYRVPMEVIQAFRNDEKYVPRCLSGLSCHELFAEIDVIMEMRDNKEMSYERAEQKIEHLFDLNKHLIFVQKVKELALLERDEMMLVLFSHLFVNNNDNNIGFHDLNFLYDSRSHWKVTKSLMESGIYILQKKNLIEFNNANGMVDRESFRMTMKAKMELFGELNLASMNQNTLNGNLIKSKDIVPKKLFHGELVENRIEELTRLLEEERYNQIRSRMKESGFRCGFTCLFYGAPGTGKTETVLQLARQTGRDILQVNVSQIKSMWVGESEKNIKALFDTYRAKVNDSKLAPILLFNEADAIIGKRQEGAVRAVDKMENAIQNIILQEMETLDGILIATTNLAQNMDKAFERRFLYKIKFEKPTLEARMCIWHEMIPALSEDATKRLADRYDFSGGQIENIARHYTISNILHGDSDDLIKTLSEYCDSERLETREARVIGF